MKLLITLFVGLMLYGCYHAQYSVKKYDSATGNIIADFEVKSRRQLEQLDVTYNRDQGAFEGKVGKASSEPSPFEYAAADMLPVILQQLYRANPPTPVE